MDKFKINNQNFSATINLKGAEITSLIELNNNYQFIWQANPKIWARHAPILFPIVGKLKNNQYQFNNQFYDLNQHGFARDLNFELLEIYTNKISLLLVQNNQTLALYPFNFKLIVSYELLESTLTTTYKIINTYKHKLPFSIGAHPGFALPDHNLENYTINFNNPNDIESYTLKDGLLSNEKYLLAQNGNTINLNNDSFKNDAIILKNLLSNSVQLKHKSNNYCIKIDFEDFTYFGIWNKYPNTEFICLEPWAGITDSINTTQNIVEKEGIYWLEPNQQKEYTFKATFTSP